MSHLNAIDVIRAWKDPEYRLSLSEDKRAQLPKHPAWLIEVTDADLASVGGGFAPAGGEAAPVNVHMRRPKLVVLVPAIVMLSFMGVNIMSSKRCTGTLSAGIAIALGDGEALQESTFSQSLTLN
jgi:mersacidin/lichenicidin family type 2 lantibiotic